MQLFFRCHHAGHYLIYSHMYMRFRALFLLACMAVPLHASDVSFNRDIRPILSDRCFHCHGPDEHDRKAKLRLDIAEGEEGAYRTHDGVTAIKPGDLSKSDLWHRITTDDEDDVMPPLDSHKKALTDREKKLISSWIKEGAPYETFWAFKKPERRRPAKVKNRSWREGMIDPYVMKELEAKGIKPKAEADKRTLIRRVAFDLTGLPPSLDEIGQYLKDDSSNAYETMVDRFLAKLSYGEHMARYWADLIRLADTNGMHKDFHREFSPFRDWMIRSFNENLSFDKFISWQLAGDLYPDATQDQLIASGYNRMHLIIDRGTALPEESFHKNVVDRMTAFGTVFLGLTVQCTQCHDHKYDPMTQMEYYKLFGFFNNFDGEAETRGRPKEGLQPPFIDLKIEVSEGIPTGQLFQKAMVYRERAEPRETFYLNRGAYDDPAEKVERDTPAFLPPLQPKGELPTRLDLADWLCRPEHPLTARVAVNRFWQQIFGVGLVKTAEDFGAQGEWPSHPELLDELAVSFVESGWDVKALMKAIVMSKTYRQSSDAPAAEYQSDPENRLLARAARYRMDAESIRDQLLFVSESLNPAIYGKSVKPPQPPGLWEAVSMASPFSYKADTGESIYRRSLYTYWRRAIPMPQMTLMNAPSREYCSARRERTNTSLQALLLMNEAEYFMAARRSAEVVLRAFAGDEQEGLKNLHERITSHLPGDERILTLQEALDDFRRMYEGNPALAAELTADLDKLDNDGRVNLAAWTMVAHGLFNAEAAKVRR